MEINGDRELKTSGANIRRCLEVEVHFQLRDAPGEECWFSFRSFPELQESIFILTVR